MGQVNLPSNLLDRIRDMQREIEEIRKKSGGSGGGGTGAVNSVSAANGTIAITGTTSNPQVGVGSITEAQVISLLTDLAAKADLVTGLVPTTELASSGIAGATTFLRGDRTWSAAVPTDTQVFNTTGTWTKPTAGQTQAFIYCVSGGNAGGSGACTDGITNTASGGGAGGGGGIEWVILPLSLLGATEPVTIGAGGVGHAGTGTANTGGLAGGGGGATLFSSGPTKCVALAAAASVPLSIGTPGLPGVVNAASGLTGFALGMLPGGQGIGAPASGFGTSGITAVGAAGGGAGGSVANPPGAFAGGSGGANSPTSSGANGKGLGGAIGTNGTDGTCPYPNEALGGPGGGGGGSAIGGANAGNGGAGAPHGGGGGGGGASVSPGVSGNGGNGGAGFVKILCW